MNFKKLCAAMLVSGICVLGFSAEPQKLFFYDISSEEFTNIYGFVNFLSGPEDKVNEIPEEELFGLYENLIGRQTFSSLLFENFLRTTDNKQIRTTVEKYIEKTKLDTPFTRTLKMIYKSKIVEQESMGQKVSRYTYKGKAFPLCNLYKLTDLSFLENQLEQMLPQVTDLEKWTCRETKDSVKGLPTGMQLSVSDFYCGYLQLVEIQKNISYENFLKKRCSTVLVKNRKNIQRFDVSNAEGVAKDSGADKYIVEFCEAKGMFDNFDTGVVDVWLYDESEKTGYQISVLVNIHPDNIFYEDRQRLFNFYAMLSSFYFLPNAAQGK